MLGGHVCGSLGSQRVEFRRGDALVHARDDLDV
jgi:hypothetical protein